MARNWSPELAEMWAKVNQRRALSGITPAGFDAAGFRSAALPYAFDLPDGLAIVEAARPVPGRWLVPGGADPRRRIVYFHGGGFVGGGWAPYKGIAAWLAQYSGSAVFFADYRRAPEHVFPAAAHDAHTMLQHAFREGPVGSGEAMSVIAAGDSAGGNLAVAAALMARDRGEPMPAACVAASGIFNLDPQTSSFLAKEKFRTDLLGCYASGAATRDPLASPLLADLSGMPPLFLQIGSADDLLDDNLQMAAAAARAGVAVQLQVVPEMPHVWQRFVGYAPEATLAVRQLARFCLDTTGAAP
jgi:acetyl esterase/lipase